MLTIKHVESSGHENVWEAVSAGFQPHEPQSVGSRRQVFAYGVPGTQDALRFDCGRVFVMNDKGNTVAMYDLGEHEPEPLKKL